MRKEWFVDDLQAVEPDALPEVEGVEVTVGPELDGQGFNRVEVRSERLSALIDYVYENWKSADDAWFREHVIDRIQYVEYETADEVLARREFLVHLNIQVPAETTTSTEEIVRELDGALGVGIDAEQTPALHIAEVEIVLAEEI